MEEPIIELNGVTMKFRLERRHYGFKNIVLHLPQYLKDRREAQTYTALDNINLKINRGERVGLIGFADIGPFIDSPVYTYSSGMQARLGFGIATAIKPEILLVDEVMAVGDADFAGKCETRINKLLAGGTTLILVSHSMADIRKYCTRVVKIDHGRIVADGPTEEVLGA